MTQYKFRMWDKVKPAHGKAFTVGQVVSSGFGRGSAWYKVEADRGDVFNCREDELELVERPICDARIGMLLSADAFVLQSLTWHMPDHYPDEGAFIVFIPRDHPYQDIWRGVFQNGKYQVWIITDDDAIAAGAELAEVDEGNILCWAYFETPIIPEPDGVGQAFSPDAED